MCRGYQPGSPTGCKLTRMRNLRGYSIIELLIVVTLVAVLALTATSFLFSSLSGSGKASGLAVVKQNGDHTIGVIERAARGALQVACPNPNSLLVTEKSGDTTYGITSLRISATGVSGTIYLTSDQIIAENFSCTVTPGGEGNPDLALVSFQLRMGSPGVDAPEKVAVERFQTRVSLRTY